MDNLQLRNLENMKHTVPDSLHLNQISLEDTHCCYFKDSSKICLFQFKTGFSSVFNVPETPQSEIVHLSYLNVWNVIFIATKSSLITYNIEKLNFTETSHKGAKIIQVSWNPTQTCLVVIEENGHLVGFNFKLTGTDDGTHGAQFEAFSSGSIDSLPPDSAYVGWGTRQTQFKGTNIVEEIIAEIPQLYEPPQISWRGNGEMFVINYWKETRRFLKLFDIDFHVLFGSQSYNNLLSVTSFKGEGNFIACAAITETESRVVIFEKNCLVKTHFSLGVKGIIKDLKYHPSKHILAVHVELSVQTTFLNIYLYANDIWYLKQQLHFSLNNCEKLLKFHWLNDLNSSYCKLNILTTNGLKLYQFAVETYGVFNDLVGVINGNEVIFTNFSVEIIPPPIGTLTLNFQRPVNEIKFYLAENIYCFQLSDNNSVFYRYNNSIFEKIDDDDDKPNEQVLPTNNFLNIFYKTICKNEYKFVLNEQGDLLIDFESIEISKVSSFHVHKNYLLFTRNVSNSYKLYTVRLTPKDLLAFNIDEGFSREIEQGGKIICVNENDEIILIMPRGNLELITCRIISIDSIEKLLESNKWNEAVNLIRHQKLNWNLLIDLNPQRFVEHAQDFIKATKSSFMLNNILTEFGTENCLETIYKGWSSEDNSLDICEISKLDILNSLLKILVELDPVSNLVSIVNIQMRHYSVKAALKSVMYIFEENHLTEAKNAIKEISNYKSINDVIKTAYTLYNLKFLNFIVKTCSEDPQTILAELKQYENLNVIDLRFTLNIRAKEFNTATKYLLQSDKEMSEILKFIKKHSTQHIAYNCIKCDDKRFQTFTILYAEYLALKAKHNEAGLILERAGLKAEALWRYKIARNWRKVIALLDSVEKEQITDILESLAEDLTNNKQVDEAAFIYEQHCNDIKATIQLFKKHKMFQKALCLAQKYNSTEIIDVNLSMKTYREDLHNKILELVNNFDNYTKRLLVLRKNKYDKLIRRKFETLQENNLVDDKMDTVSEYESIFSQSSMSSFSSSRDSKSSKSSARSRRKMERKKIDSREGSTFEDIALIRTLYLLVSEINDVALEVAEVLNCLIDEEHFSYSKMLQNCYENAQLTVICGLPKIWSETFLNVVEPSSTHPNILAVIENRHELDEQYRSPPEIISSEKWKSSIFQ